MIDSTPVSIRQALIRAAAELTAAGGTSAVLDAELLLARTLVCERDLFFREPERPLSAPERERFEVSVARRAAGEPLQHITGVQEFWSMEFGADGRALIPRPETEHLVEAALRRIPADTAARVLDLCTGSGIVAAVLARERPRAEVTATDISPEALSLAVENLRRLALENRVRLLRGDLFAPLGLPEPRFQLVTANPPYVSQAELAELDREVRDHEPLQALDGGPDGLAVIRRIIDQAGAWLVPGGWLLIEVGAGQWGTVEKIVIETGGWGEPSWVLDLAGYRRVLCLPVP
jgi:release factor glutamine methyltransferase